MSPAYWLGRYLALHDRFRSDYLTPDFLSSPKLRHCWMAIPDDAAPTTDEAEPSASCRGDERLSKRVFAHLEALCVNAEARESLKAFQQSYARRFGCEALLPAGGCMVDREQAGGFIAKAGRLFSGRGRKSSIGVGGGIPRRRSTLSMGFTAGNSDT
jgi:hypothetical protein